MTGTIDLAAMTELNRTTSDYLCIICKGLLYLNIRTKEEVCVNSSCVMFPRGTVFGDTNSPVLRNDMKAKRENLIRLLQKTNAMSITAYAYEIRRNLVSNFFSRGTLDTKRFFGVNELLIELNKTIPRARRSRESNHMKILDDFTGLVDTLNFIDNMETQRYLVSTAPDRAEFVLKYYQVFRELYNNYGIVNIDQISKSRLWRYSDVDSEAKKETNLNLVITDFGEYFAQQFDIIVSLKYLLGLNYRTTLQFRYDVEVFDVALFLGLIFGIGQDTKRWTMEGLRTDFNLYPESKKTFSKFVEEFVASHTKAPIIVRRGSEVFFDRFTLFFFILYLMGPLSDRLPRKNDVESLPQKKELVSQIFEGRVRNLVRGKGFIVPDAPITIAEAGEEYEYDVIGVSQEDRLIILAEVKYRDFAPSSMTGKTLIRQELLDRDDDKGLLWTAIRQQKRRDFFLNHYDKFAAIAELQIDNNNYTVESFVITKYSPLISAYRRVQVANFDSFEEILQGLKTNSAG